MLLHFAKRDFYTLPREIGRHIWRHYGQGEREGQDRIDEQGAIGEFLEVRTVRNGEKRKVASFPPPAFSFVVPSFPCLRPESLPSSAVFLCLMTSLRPILLLWTGRESKRRSRERLLRPIQASRLERWWL